MKNISILGISGSLRADSMNTLLLKTLADFLPGHVRFQLFESLDEIPHFSPGIPDHGGVIRFKQAIQMADGVIICTPEYAFGVPGTLKNALDWTVATGDLNDKPVAAISASPLNTGGDKALASLLLTLTALGTKRNDESSLAIPNIKLKINSLQKISDEPTIAALKAQCTNLLKIIG
ncbi:NADPH-dependent FMN reductase [Dyadobacter fanqingshengii]|uniref:NAD(P)H-dependent oxidoreductase n=1 Tax=Dyadobacter fanqingshengii TaxID=2906443 RepID=A0A9X1PBS9_9BACT|nr:NADPH-dependent FMN reductase [Dyadobacter fanqingshengii]MCF0041023.1 NAD(P)H-dependent oxidoreductase [Dyadobacter fanqingshengii]USJ37246.1 NAD(P)H-dependent oxidoreductase [Dyadobacter fanqingshengii]